MSVGGAAATRAPAWLEAGLALLVIAAPLPFGAVGPGGRTLFEIGALLLTAAWSLHALWRPTPLPPRPVVAGALGLLALAALQIVPWPGGRISVDPGATASALRTGAALVGILFVATSVVAWRGGTRLGHALLLSAGFQGLYGVMVVASGHPFIWGVPKTAYLESATGTFINRNNYAAFLAATLPVGAGLLIAAARRVAPRPGARRSWLIVLGNDGSRALILGLVAATGLAGLLLSLSRAGTILGLAAIALTGAVLLRRRAWPAVAIAALLAALAAIPLLDIGAERLTGRLAASGEELTTAGGRLSVWHDTIEMAAARPATGAGFGTFTWAFPRYRSAVVRLHYTHAHEDLLQLAAEGGLVALVLLALVLVPLAKVTIASLGGGADPPTRGAALGLCALLLHALVDFPFHIPAVALVGCVLAGWMFGARWTSAD